jgi:hypothetical protein
MFGRRQRGIAAAIRQLLHLPAVLNERYLRTDTSGEP